MFAVLESLIVIKASVLDCNERSSRIRNLDLRHAKPLITTSLGSLGAKCGKGEPQYMLDCKSFKTSVIAPAFKH